MNKKKTVIKRFLNPNVIASVAALAFATQFFAVANARGNDPWNDKDPAAWNQKDVQKILTDSPWSKQLQFGIAADGSLSQNLPSIGVSGSSEISGTSPGGATGRIDSPPRITGSNGPTGSPSDFKPVSKFTVSWHSSHIIREAILRERELSNESQDQASKDLAVNYDTYQISISGTDLRAFVKEGAANLKTRSHLVTKSAKQTIPPSNIIVQGTENGTIIAIIFEFPRKTSTGEPTIAPTEKSVEFDARVGALPLKVTFDVSKMFTKVGRDL
jgi:hypothetical protein